jgi:hypothetical protein
MSCREIMSMHFRVLIRARGGQVVASGGGHVAMSDAGGAWRPLR